jgi:hypothetical protein
VVAIERKLRKGFQARVVDSNGPDTKLEHMLTFSEEEFRSLKGAQAALEAFHGGNKTEDEDDDGSCICITWFPSYLGSWITRFLPKERSFAFACAGAAPPATIPPATINTNTELLVLEDNVARYPPRTLLLLISIMLAWS